MRAYRNLIGLVLTTGLLVACNAERLVELDPTDVQEDMSRSVSTDLVSDPTTCRGRFCQVPQCPAGRTTEIVGRLFAGNGVDPIPGAAVFVPVYDLPEFPIGPKCDLCNDIPLSVASSPTAIDGSFRLRGVPAGMVPVVARLGRFQRVVWMQVQPCVENTINADPGTNNQGIRLPRKNREVGAQDLLPRIAVGSGDYDQIECVLKRIGVDEIDMYNGRNPGTTNPPSIGELSDLLNDDAKLFSYNIVIINCTENQYQGLLATKSVQQRLERFVGSGGRLYVTDWAYDVIEQVPEFSPYICFEPQSSGSSAMCTMGPERATGADSGNPYGGASRVLDTDMQKWLAQFPGTISASKDVFVDFSFVVVNKTSDDEKGKTKIWVEGPTDGYGTRPLTVTFDYKTCGRVHYSTYNTEPDAGVTETMRWPNNCKAKFTPQERLLEFLFFNIAACVNVPG